VTKDEALHLALEELENCADLLKVFGAPIDSCVGATMLQAEEAIAAIKQALEQPVQEPVAMRMPKVGDRVVCIEDESLGTVVYLTAGGSPEIKFDDGSHGTYMLREFAELFGYTTPPAAQRQWVGLTDEEIFSVLGNLQRKYNGPPTEDSRVVFALAIEAKLKERNQ
jgi:hypothetical protein